MPDQEAPVVEVAAAPPHGLRKFERLLVALNTRIISRLGVALFVPALTALMDRDLAKAFISQFPLFHHIPDVDITLMAASVAGIAGFLLYQGKPEKTQVH